MTPVKATQLEATGWLLPETIPCVARRHVRGGGRSDLANSRRQLTCRVLSNKLVLPASHQRRTLVFKALSRFPRPQAYRQIFKVCQHRRTDRSRRILAVNGQGKKLFASFPGTLGSADAYDYNSTSTGQCPLTKMESFHFPNSQHS